MAERTARPYTPKRGAHAGETFRSYRAYRDRVAQDQGWRNYYAFSKRHRDPVYAVLLRQARARGLSEQQLRARYRPGRFQRPPGPAGAARDQLADPELKQRFADVLSELGLDANQIRDAWRRFYRGEQ